MTAQTPTQASRTVRADDGTQLEVRVFGDADAAALPVLFVHGWMVSGAVFDELLAQIEGPRLQLIVPDLRGSGRSQRPTQGYSLQRYVDDVVAVADAVGAERFVLVGHSMGGQLAQLAAAQHPERVRGLFLLSPVPVTGIPLPDDARGLFRGCGGSRELQGTILNLACKELTEAARARLLDDSVQTEPVCVAQAFEAWSAGAGAVQLEAITAPTLVVGTDDPFLPQAFLREQVAGPIPGARLVHLPGPGHYPQIERVRETAALLTAFLTPLAAGRVG